MRSTFASNSLAAGVTVFELARLMGTSVAMIERHYGTLLDGAGADLARRLSAFETAREVRCWGRKVAGSNPVAPTKGRTQVVRFQPPSSDSPALSTTLDLPLDRPHEAVIGKGAGHEA